MKLIYAIVRTENEDDVVDALMREGFFVTRLSSTGGFLRKGNTTLMIATEEERVEDCIQSIKHQCGRHQKVKVQMPSLSDSSSSGFTTMPMDVDIGGATIMVLELDRFEKY